MRLAVAIALAPMLAAQRVEIALPDGAVKVSLELPALKRSATTPNPERTLLYGELGGDGRVSLLFESNFPFVSGAECAKRRAKMPRYAAFDVDGVACCTWSEATAGITHTTYHAWPTTPDYLFDLHVSCTTANKAGQLSRDDFSAIVRSFRSEGRIDPATQRLPAEVYAVRDEAAAQSAEQLAWLDAQCKTRVEEWAPHFYLGALAYQRDDNARLLRGYERAAALLAAKADRAAKETRALIEALDAVAAAHAMKERYRDAIEPLNQLVALIPAGAEADVAEFRTMALYHLAGCLAKTGKTDEALASLKGAIAARASFKESAQTDELFKSLRSKPEFKKLVGL